MVSTTLTPARARILAPEGPATQRVANMVGYLVVTRPERDILTARE
jgi:hypothetical protein